MEYPRFQKAELPNGEKYIIMRSGIGEPEREWVVNQVTSWGNVFQMYGTYDECMDFISDKIYNCTVEQKVENNLTRAAREMADENFHKTIG